MTNTQFEARVKAAGLQPMANDLSKLEALANDLDRAAAALRGPMPYALEPMSTLKLPEPER